jgi:oligopeptide/dipeptide ABC transporter ATP-binding protein
MKERLNHLESTLSNESSNPLITPLLRIENLRTIFESKNAVIQAVYGLSLDVRRGETTVLLGESGCGKSVTALSILRLIPPGAGRIVSGTIQLDGVDLIRLPESDMRNVRGRRIAMIFQDPQSSLNPVFTVGEQISEPLRRHFSLSGEVLRARVMGLLNDVGISDPKRCFSAYPHEISGGMKQRVMIAIALAGEPELLIADEPTTALDVTIQSQILELLRNLQENTGLSMLFITHDLGVAAQIADRVAVMYAGHVVELANRDDFFNSPQHPYSKKLFEALPERRKRGEGLAIIKGAVPSLAQTFSGCRFEPRCDFSWKACEDTPPAWIVSTTNHGVRCHLMDPNQVVERPMPETPGKDVDSPDSLAMCDTKSIEEPLLQVSDLQVYFPIREGLFQRVTGHLKAVDGVSLDIHEGRTLALVGESGCGKTTLGKAILQLVSVSSGSVRFDGTELTTLKGEALRTHRKDFQTIFQDPFSSLNPRLRVGEIIEEGMIVQALGGKASERNTRIDELLVSVGLTPEIKSRYAVEFSGGQRQRISIARVLALNPKLIVCDEPTSALDVSVQAQILNLLEDIQKQKGLSYLFISHNLAVVKYLAHEVAVMYMGRIVEKGKTDEVLDHPLHPYTQALLSAAPTIDGDTQRLVIRLHGDLPSPIDPPKGCHFHQRCPYTMPICREEYPPVISGSATHQVRCFLNKKA